MSWLGKTSPPVAGVARTSLNTIEVADCLVATPKGGENIPPFSSITSSAQCTTWWNFNASSPSEKLCIKSGLFCREKKSTKLSAAQSTSASRCQNFDEIGKSYESQILAPLTSHAGVKIHKWKFLSSPTKVVCNITMRCGGTSLWECTKILLHILQIKWAWDKLANQHRYLLDGCLTSNSAGVKPPRSFWLHQGILLVTCPIMYSKNERTPAGLHR